MNSKSDGEFGTVLLRCHWRRVFSVLMVAIGLAITLAFSHVVSVERSRGLKSLAALVILLGLLSTVIGVRNIINPPVLFEVTSRGVLMRMEGGAVFLSPPFFIPWERVGSMKYVVRKETDAVGDRRTSEFIALKVSVDGTWSPVGHLKRNYEKSTGCVLLDALTGTPHGQELFRQVEEIRAEHSHVS